MNEQTRTLLRCVYWAYVAMDFDRENHVEVWLEIDNLGDIVINESTEDDWAEYRSLFSDESRQQLLGELRRLCFRLGHKLFEDCKPEIAVLKFLQFVGARGIWKHRLDIGNELERFTREYDRLDIEDEQRRLHRECQLQSDTTTPPN